MVTTYTEWCEAKGVTHAHCPRGCWHPQPMLVWDGRLLCGRCWHVDGAMTEMVPCQPETCPDH
jgi:hypothetical protein